MKAAFLLRASQAGLVLGGVLLILIGSGIDAGWIRSLAFVAITGGIGGLIGEELLRRRSAGEDLGALLLPVAGMMSGVFVLVANG